MNARKMFRELGFKYEEYAVRTEHYIEYTLDDTAENRFTIVFMLLKKDMAFYGHCAYFDVSLFKAIHQQLKELHWIED